MSRLYLGTDTESLAAHFAQALARRLPEQDPFQPINIVVPNPHLGKWLRLEMARHLGVVMNWSFSFLEKTLWDLFREVDPRPHAERPELLDGDLYHLLVLTVLLEHDGRELKPLHDYLGRADRASPAYWRRAWHVAERMSRLIRDYEYHRRTEFILPWLTHRSPDPRFIGAERALERAEATLFHQIIREPGGIRQRLNREARRNFKTLPQYAGEVMELDIAPSTGPKPQVSLFGVTQLSALHVHALAWLSRRFDIQMYFVTPLANRLPQDAPWQETLQTLRTGAEGDMFARWSRAGVESLSRLEELSGVFAAAPVPSTQAPKEPPTVLASLQASFLTAANRSTAARLPQDLSLQIVGCPGVEREAETVYQSILRNLNEDASLRMTDIAVLVTDMETYRPALQAVFERDPATLRYSLVDHNAAGVSLWGRALLGMLDLAQENFARSSVFEVILNPCFLERLGVAHADAQVWLHWAEELGAYHGWDAAERAERGQERMSLFGWRQALQRLRLGRYMEGGDDPFVERKHFGALVPHADIASGDRAQVDAFCLAIEGLLPVLWSLRREKHDGAWWAARLRFLAERFLAVPEDRPAESRVAHTLLASLDRLELWDRMNGAESAKIPLPLVRAFVAAGLEGISAGRGEFLTEGITLSALQPMRPVPFKIIYVLGLNEHLFPGRNALSSLDLRAAGDRLNGDVLPAEQQLFLLLEALLSARDKLYLLYNNRDVQKDRELLPATPLMQLKRYLEESIVAGAFGCVKAPLAANDPRYVVRNAGTPQDVLAQFGRLERGLAVEAAAACETLSPRQRRDLEAWRAERQRVFDQPLEPVVKPAEATLTLSRLRAFLLNPAQAFLQRQLYIDKDDEKADQDDDEPFYSDAASRHGILSRLLERIVHEHAAGSEGGEERWTEALSRLYEDYRLRGKTPAGAFGAVDCDSLRRQFLGQAQGEHGLQAFLAERPPDSFQGPILLGASQTPIGARLRFAPLELRWREGDVERQARVAGHFQYAWAAPGRLDLLCYTWKKYRLATNRLKKQALDPVLFCLTLLAHQDAAAQALVRDAAWHIHLVTGDGICRFVYPAGAISADEARAYLQRLAADCLGATDLELLPLELVLEEHALYDAATGRVPISAAAFKQELEIAIEESRDWPRPNGWDSALLQLLDPPLPEDALDKVRRRLELLDRGPAAEPNKPRRKANNSTRAKTATAAGKNSARRRPTRRRSPRQS